MNTNNTKNLDVLVPLPFNPKPGKYTGRFISKDWEVEEKDGKPISKELVIKVELNEKDALEQNIVVERRYNMLPRARGINDFKNDMAVYLGYKIDKEQKIDEFPAKLLAKQSLIELDGKPVSVLFKAGKGKNATFDKFIDPEKLVPTTATQSAPVAAAPAA